jgi:cell division protein ZapA (FtsZ GTPase activity inhibitor)
MLKLSIIHLMFGVILISCTTSQSSAVYSQHPEMAQTSTGLVSAEDKSNRFDVDDSDRKILFNAILSLTVDVPDSASAQIKSIAKQYHGYIHEIGTYRCVIRVQSNSLEEALNAIAELGKLQHKTIRGQDVTDDYLDYQIRLENAQQSRKRYLELLAKAENVEAALKVEKELERLNETIDLLKGKMNRIDHLSAFSTITINLKEKTKPGILGYISLGVYHSVKWLFVRN